MFARSHAHLQGIRKSVERTRDLSDRVVGVGPFGLGLDGILAVVPGVGAAYSVAAGGLILLQAVRARASVSTLVSMAALLLVDSALDAIPVPLLPAAADIVFTGHKWASNLLLKHMEATLYYEGTRQEAEADPKYQEAVAMLRKTGDRRRIVYLHD